MAKAPSEFALEAPRSVERTATEKRRQRGKAVRRREKHEANKGAREPKSRIEAPTAPFVITNRPPEVRRGGGGESFVERRRDEPAEGWLRYIAKTYGPGRFWVTGANEVVIRLQPTAEMVARFERETEPRANPVAPVVAAVPAPIPPPQGSADVLEELRRLNRRFRRLEARVEEAETVEEVDEDEARSNPVDLEALVEVAVKKATDGAKPAMDPMKLFELAAKLYMQRSATAPAPTPAVNPPVADPKAAAWAAAIPAMEAAGWTPAQVVEFIAAEAARERGQADAGASPQS